MRHVAYECGHISTVNVDFLAMHAEDPRAEEWEGHGANSFSILHPCGDGKTKYQALFYPLMAPGATDYRRRFFHAAQDDMGAALLSKVLEIFNGWRRAGALTLGGRIHVLSQEQTRLAEQGYDILNFWYDQRINYPALPQSFTVEAGWPALRQALQHCSYWLSAAELQCVAAFWSCRAHVHIDHGLGITVCIYLAAISRSRACIPFRRLCDAQSAWYV